MSKHDPPQITENDKGPDRQQTNIGPPNSKLHSPAGEIDQEQAAAQQTSHQSSHLEAKRAQASKVASLLARAKESSHHLSYLKGIPRGTTLASLSFAGAIKLQSEINDLTNRIGREINDSIGDEPSEEETNKKESEQRIESLTRDVQMLEQKKDLAFLLSRVTELAHEVLLSEHPLRHAFFSASECPTFVVSMDIRQSTELMLKAREPALFAQFMTNVCDGLSNIIKKNFGVVDKFNGDGVLSFFPEFFSGKDAAFLAITTAQEAHTFFVTCYREHRQSFYAVLNDVGLGIGIDFGSVRLMHIAGGLTVVGPAVVYACRMGGAPAGRTYLNQPAYEKVSDRYSASCFISETELAIKHEGKMLAYDLTLTSKPFSTEQPSWITEATPEAITKGIYPS